jgi:hypothetical protein
LLNAAATLTAFGIKGKLPVLACLCQAQGLGLEACTFENCLSKETLETKDRRFSQPTQDQEVVSWWPAASNHRM